MKKKRETKKKVVEKENKGKKQNKQLIAILVTIAIIFIIVFTVYILVQKSKSFNYYGIKFEKILYGELPLYYAKIPILRNDRSRINYNLYIRNDPRANKIPIDAKINFKLGTTYVTTDKGVGFCEDANLALVNLGSFLNGIGIRAKGATSSLEIAVKTDYPFITCENSSDNTVISLEVGDMTGIEQKKDCYILKIEDCNLINITEKFIVETVVQHMVRA